MFPRENWLNTYLDSLANPEFLENSIIKGDMKMVMKMVKNNWAVKEETDMVNEINTLDKKLEMH